MKTAANQCDTIDLGGQNNLASSMPEVAGIGDNQYQTGLSVTQSKLNSAVPDEDFSCGDGYELDTTVSFVCNYPTTTSSQMAVFSGQLCKPITCAACAGTATGADAGKTCDLDAATDSTAACPTGCTSTAGDTTDAWCAFIQDTTSRSAAVDCAATPTHVWCLCLDSTASLTGTSASSANADWLADNQCHPIFDTGACHHDAGDCSGTFASSCEDDLQSDVRAACCTTSNCAPLPDLVTESCARVFRPFWSRCAYETTLPYQPMWVWAGMDLASTTKLNSPSATCTSTPAVSYSIGQRCDANCDCADCSDEETDSNGNACTHPYNGVFCTSAVNHADRICTCWSGAQIPFEWVCDGSNDCGLREDESASACQEDPTNVDLALWDVTYPVEGRTKTCISRWQLEVVGVCTGLDAASVAASSCSAACAAKYLDWFFDCKMEVLNVTGSDANLGNSNSFFDCCLNAHTTGQDAQCSALTTLASCEGDGTSLDIGSLGDNVCDAKLDCDAYLEDGGDCATAVTVTLPFTVIGTFSADDFVSALVTPNNFLQDDDITVRHYRQTITAELNLGCNYDGAVNSVLMGSPAGRTQLKAGIASWLGIMADKVIIDAVTSSTVATKEVVQVEYTVLNAHKDVSEDYAVTAAARSTDLLTALDAAYPQAIPIDLASCGSHFIASAPSPAPDVVSAALSVQTSIRVEVRVVETEYELAVGTLSGTDSERAAGMQTAIVAALQNDASILTNLNAAAGCTGCITGVSSQPSELEVVTVTPQGSVIAELSESEVALAVAIILVLVIGGCVCCITLLICTVYWYKRKQKRQIMLVDQAGNIIKEFEEESDNAEREVLMQVLHHYIEEQERVVQEKQAAEEEELIATLEAYEVIEDASVPEEEGNDLLAAANAEAKAAKKDREAKRKKAQERLAKRRADLLETQKDTLKNAGVAEDVVEVLFEEIDAADQEADTHRADLESSLDQQQIDEESILRAELEAKMADASSDEERADLEVAYQADMAKSEAAMNGERKSQRDKLNARLKKRKAGVQAKIDEKLAEVVDEQVLHTGAEERDQMEDEAAAEADDDDTAGELSAAFKKDAKELQATRDAKKAAAQKRLEERRLKMAAKHKTELIDAGAPVEVAEKQVKELNELAALEAKQLQQQEAVMKKKEAAALAKQAEEEAAQMATAETDDVKAQVAADFAKNNAALKKKNADSRSKQRSKLNDRLAKRQKQLQAKHTTELEEVAPEAVIVSEVQVRCVFPSPTVSASSHQLPLMRVHVLLFASQSEERAALAAMTKALTATQEELAAEKAKHQTALDDLSAKHDEQLRMQQNKFEEMKREFDDLSKQKFDNIQSE